MTRYWPGLVIVVPALLWVLYWVAAAFAVEQGSRRFLQDRQYGDMTSSFADIQRSGFPTDFRFDYSEFQIAKQGLLSWSIPAVRLSASGHRPQAVRLEALGPQTVRGRFGTLDIISQNAAIKMLFRLAATVPLDRAELLLKAVSFVHEDGWRLDADEVLGTLQEAGEAEPGADMPQQGQGRYRLQLDATGLDISAILTQLPPDYQQVPVITVDTGLIFERPWDRSLLEQGPPRLRGLFIHDGQIRLGAADIALSGQLVRSDDGLVSGEVIIDIHGWRDLVTTLRQAEYLDPDIADLIFDFLDRGDDPMETMTLPLKLQNGQVSFGIFTLGVLPALP